MDNRITKKRLSEFFAYDWIMVIAVICAVIIFWELVLSITSVKVTVGQQFKLYYDYTVSTNYVDNLIDLENEYGVLSEDILDFNIENLREDYDLLGTRLQLNEGDIIVTSCYFDDEEEDYVVRSDSIIDAYKVYDFKKLIDDCKKYLSTFLQEDKTDSLDYYSLDEEKIKDRFLIRERGDNRYRTEEQKEQGIELEKARIKLLCEETTNLKFLLDNNPELFYSYTRFTQSLRLSTSEENKEKYGEYVNKSEELYYGLKVEKLQNGKTPSSLLFRRNDVKDATSDDVVIMAFNFWDENQPNNKNLQYDLQFEVIPFLTMIVKECSDIKLPY